MFSTLRQQAGAGLVAAGIIAASFAQGLFQPLGFGIAAVVVWAAIVAGGIGGLLPTAPPGRLTVWAAVLLAAAAILATVSMAWAHDQGRAFEEALRVWLYLGLFLLASFTAGGRGRNQWLVGMAIGFGVVSILALVAYLQPGFLTSGRLDIANAQGQLSYPLGYWNAAAAMMAVSAVLLAHWSAAASGRALRTIACAGIPLALLGIWLASSRGGLAVAVVGAAILISATTDRSQQVKAIALAAVGGAILIVVSDQMSGLTSGSLDSARRDDGDLMSALCIVVVAGVAVAAWLGDGWRPRVRISRRLAIGLAVGALVALVAGIAAAGPAERFREFKSAPPSTSPAPVGATGVSSNGRWQFWGAALDAFDSEPAGGLGAGGFEGYWAQHASILRFVRNPHSLPLQQAAELGILGVAVLAGFVAVLGVAIARRFRPAEVGDAGPLTAVLAAAALGSLTDWTWEFPALFLAALVPAGLLISSARSAEFGRPRWVATGTLALGFASIAAGLLIVASDIEMRQSRSAAAAGRLDDAIDRARDAHRFAPWSAAPYTQLALLEEQRGDLQQAFRYLNSAKARDTADWRLSVIEARLLYSSGDGVGARMSLARARTLSPLFFQLGQT
jgi:O-Antigen ligase